MTYKHTQSGFSLVETLVALTILLLVMIGPMTITMSSARSTSFASEQVTAFFLAQEGVELVEQFRDNRLLDAANTPSGVLHASFWNSFTNTGAGAPLHECYQNSGCAMEMNTVTRAEAQVVSGCSSLTSCRLYFRDNTNSFRTYFTHTNTGTGTITPTPYTRQIFLSVLSADQVRVRSRVTWHSGNINQNQVVEVESYLFNVYGN